MVRFSHKTSIVDFCREIPSYCIVRCSVFEVAMRVPLLPHRALHPGHRACYASKTQQLNKQLCTV